MALLFSLLWLATLLLAVLQGEAAMNCAGKKVPPEERMPPVNVSSCEPAARGLAPGVQLDRAQDYVIYFHFHKAGGTEMCATLACNSPIWGPALSLRIPKHPPKFMFSNCACGEFDHLMKRYKAEQRKGPAQYAPLTWEEVALRFEEDTDPGDDVATRICFIENAIGWPTPDAFQNMRTNMPRLKFFAMLRHPWARFVSKYEYEYVRRPKEQRSQYTLDAYEHRSVGWVGNLTNSLVKSLIGVEQWPPRPESHIEIDESHLEQAKEVLRKFDMLLVLEEDDEIKSYMLSYFLKDPEANMLKPMTNGNPYSDNAEHNVNSKKQHEIPPLVAYALGTSPELLKYKEGWLERNKFDVELYYWAQEQLVKPSAAYQYALCMTGK